MCWRCGGGCGGAARRSAGARRWMRCGRMRRRCGAGWARREQRRFLRHARPYWDVHRHRIAPQVAAQLAEMIGEGRLEVVAGRVTTMVEEGGKVVRDLYAPGPCLSPDRGALRRRLQLHRAAGGDGAEPRSGVAADDRGRAGRGRTSSGWGWRSMARAARASGVWALGPLTKGAYWEIVAVPDIRGQAAQVADDIARELEA